MRGKQISIGESAAIRLAATRWWEGCSSSEIAEVQLLTVELCTPFDVFHAALEESLGRSVWIHELAFNIDGVIAEFLGEKEPPSFSEILELIPEEKRLVIVANGDWA